MAPFEGRRPSLGRVLLTAAGVVLIAVTLFRVPLATVFTFGLLLICPLLMAGMHGGDHGADHSPLDEARGQQRDTNDDRATHLPTASSPAQIGAPDPHANHHTREAPADRNRLVQRGLNRS